MSSKTRKVIVVEFNEITWDLIEPLVKKGALPNFERFIKEGARGEPWANEHHDQLDPWVTWTTVYTGVPQEVHGLSMLEQDRETLGAKRMWEYLKEAGLRIGLFGSANTWPPAKVDGFWVPGPFARDFATYPEALEPIQALNVGLTRGHTAEGIKPPSMKSLFPKLLKLGLPISTIAGLVPEIVSIKRNPKTLWKKIAFQPIVNLGLFSSLYRKHRPHFATFHSNHVAYYMHRFWRAMDPSLFEVKPTEEEVNQYGGAVEYGYRVADQVIGQMAKLAGRDANVVILSSCGQQPATGGRYSRDQEQGNVGLQLKIEKLIAHLGIQEQVEFSNLMAPQWKLDFTDEALLKKTVADLEGAHNITRDCKALNVEPEGMSICLGAVRNQGMDDTIELNTATGLQQFRAGDLLSKHAEVAKSGKHHPKGVLLMMGPDVRPGADVGKCDNLDLAPTLMALLDQPIPDVMQGRVLEDALVSAPAQRVLVNA